MLPIVDPQSLEGVGQALAHAQASVDACIGARAVRVDAARVAGVGAVRGAAAAAGLEPHLETTAATAGALRVNAEVPRLAGLWSSAPLQVLARLHMLAAADVLAESDLGRPVSPDAAAVLREVAEDRTVQRPGLLSASLAHGRLVVDQPFGRCSGLVALGLQRVVLIARGVDTIGVLAPELGHAADPDAYRWAVDQLATGDPAGLASWVEHCCMAYATAADRALSAQAEPSGANLS